MCFFFELFSCPILLHRRELQSVPLSHSFTPPELKSFSLVPFFYIYRKQDYSHISNILHGRRAFFHLYKSICRIKCVYTLCLFKLTVSCVLFVVLSCVQYVIVVLSCIQYLNLNLHDTSCIYKLLGAQYLQYTSCIYKLLGCNGERIICDIYLQGIW